jgi:hypothetical protein
MTIGSAFFLRLISARFPLALSLEGKRAAADPNGITVPQRTASEGRPYGPLRYNVPQAISHKKPSS